ncbi:MAG: hypothetical protein JWN07_1746 [Hyphomicrobiales bacterium]|nr:hypothetical protein [Hyphomicrobiales bacterium]
MQIRLALLCAALSASTALAQPAQRADICVELADYLTKQQTQKPADAAPPQQQATAVQAPAKDGERPQPGGADSAQQTSGMSGPVTHGGTGASGPQGQAQESAPSGQQNPQANGGSQPAANRPPEQAQGQPQPGQPPQPQGQQQAAANPPAAAAAPQAPPPKPEAIAAAQAAIDQKDVLACRDVAQKMRRAGVNIPASLMALAALDPKILKPQDGAGGNPASP